MSGLVRPERFVALIPSLARELGSVKAALVVQFVYYRMRDGEARLSYDDVAEGIGCSRRTACTYLTMMVEEGVLQSRRASATDAARIYRVNPDHAIFADHRASSARSDRASSARSSVCTEGSKNPPTPQAEASETAASPDGEGAGEFERWWAHYPRKQGRGAAVKAFKAARKKATLTEIGQGLMDAKRYWDRMETPMDKIPYPATWLNQDRWLDEHPVVEAAAPAAGAEDPSGWMHRTPENTP